MAEKTKVDVGRGFKRIFSVIATVWGIFLLIAILVKWDDCEPYPNYTPPSHCIEGDSFGVVSLPGRLIEGLIVWAITTAVVYYFLKWIGAGFKKRKK